MGKIIGIDLGTTNSCVAVIEGGKPTVIPSAEGGRTVPSVVAFGKHGERLVGDTAKRQAVTNSERTVSSIKRQMGIPCNILIDKRKYTPQEISAYILMKLKKDAENYLGERVTEAIITVPAYFNDAARQATKDAGRIAGLNVLRIINEPTAAALAYGLDNGETQKILVFDLGGGTFDVSIIEIGDKVIEVLATSGDNKLGGDDFDERLVKYIIYEFRMRTGLDISKDRMALQRVREESEKVKKELSSRTIVNVNLPFLMTTKKGPCHLDIDISREKFEEITADLIDRIAVPVNNALNDAKIKPQDLSKVVLVGGSTRMPAVALKVKEMIGIEPSRNMNPDECVAIGAAIQGAKLAGDVSVASELLLLDVTPLTLSIETMGGVATKLIERNSTIPCRKSQIFSTAVNYQPAVEIKVLQGERSFARDNKLLGTFRLTGIRRALAGEPQIEVTFDIDANGIVHVSARDLDTGREQGITISSSSNLSEKEIQNAMREAAEYAETDDFRIRAYGILENAEKMISRAEKLIANSGKTMPRNDKALIKSQITTVSKIIRRMKVENMTEADIKQIEYAVEQLKLSIERD